MFSTNDRPFFLSRTEAASFLTKRGYPIAGQTLATQASRGGGPEYVKWGGRVLYRPETLLDWAEKRLTKARASTSEADVPTSHDQ
jgi:hypothetical protein